MKGSVKYFKIFANLLVALVAIFLVIYLCPKVIVFFMPFVIGYIVSLIANPMVRFLAKRLKIVRKHGSVIIVLFVLVALLAIAYLIVHWLVVEMIQFGNNLPQWFENISAEIYGIADKWQGVLQRMPESIKEGVEAVVSGVVTYMKNWIAEAGAPTIGAVGDFAKNIPSIVVGMLMCVLSSFYFTSEHDNLNELVKKYTPKDVMDTIGKAWHDFVHVVGGYFKAQLKIMCIVFAILLIGLLIMKVDYAILIALGIAILDMLPVFGAGLPLGPWALVKLLAGDYFMAIGLVVLYAVIQVVRQVVQPRILGDSIGMSPLMTLFWMFLGYKVSGFGGMILAVPIGMIIINLVKSGIFDVQIRCIKELVHDFNKFRKMDD